MTFSRSFTASFTRTHQDLERYVRHREEKRVEVTPHWARRRPFPRAAGGRWEASERVSADATQHFKTNVGADHCTHLYPLPQTRRCATSGPCQYSSGFAYVQVRAACAARARKRARHGGGPPPPPPPPGHPCISVRRAAQRRELYLEFIFCGCDTCRAASERVCGATELAARRRGLC